MPQRSVRILVVDDDRELRTLVADILQDDGYEAVACAGGVEALEILGAERFDLLLMDVRMPGMSGMELLTRIRALPLDVGVIVVTGYGSKETAIEALRGRALDYLEKPLTIEQLRSAVRRGLQARSPGERWRGVRSHGDLTMDADSRRAWMRGAEVQLTRIEFDLLAYLLGRPGCAVSHRELLEQVWGDQGTGERGAATVKSCVCRLRRKIGDVTEGPVQIRSVRGVGYQLGDPS